MKAEIPEKCTLCGGDFEIDGKRAIYPYPEKENLCLTCFTKKLNLQPQERIAHGILAGVKLTVKPLIGNDKSQAEAREYFTNGQEEINKGLELIPDRLRIRLATAEDVNRFKIFHGLAPEVPRIGEVLIEAEYSDPKEFLSEFNVITKTQLSICLLKKEHVFLKSVYSFSKVDNMGFQGIIVHPIPMPEIYASLGINIHPDDKEEITKIIKKINCLDSNTLNSIRLVGNRLLRSSHNLLSEDTLIDLCIAMEALFLGGEYQRSDLGMGQVIGLACSMLIGKDNTERTEIKKTIWSGFKLRNKVVHGYDIDENIRKSINEILQDFKDYLIRSILKLL